MDISTLYDSAKKLAEKIKNEKPDYVSDPESVICFIVAEDDKIYGAASGVKIVDGNIDTLKAECNAMRVFERNGGVKAKNVIKIKAADSTVVEPDEHIFKKLMELSADNGECEVAVSDSEMKKVSEFGDIKPAEAAPAAEPTVEDFMSGFGDDDVPAEAAEPAAEPAAAEAAPAKAEPSPVETLGAPAEFADGFKVDESNPFYEEPAADVPPVDAPDFHSNPNNDTAVEQAVANNTAYNPVGGMPQQGGYAQQGAVYPQQGGYAQQGAVYPQQGGYAQQGAVYPQQGGYAQQGAAYPQQGGYAQQGAAYPQQGGYAQQGAAYPQQGGYAQQGAAYPQQGGYAQQGAAYPQQGAAYPQQGAAYAQQSVNASMYQNANPLTSQPHASAGTQSQQLSFLTPPSIPSLQIPSINLPEIPPAEEKPAPEPAPAPEPEPPAEEEPVMTAKDLLKEAKEKKKMAKVNANYKKKMRDQGF